MVFSVRELAAIQWLAMEMTIMDDWSSELEERLLLKELCSHTDDGLVSPDVVLEWSNSMNKAEAIDVVSNMTWDEKYYVLGYLAALSAIDRDIDRDEYATWKNTRARIGMSGVSFEGAVEFFNNQKKW
jgi:hypothetical protein